MYIELDQPVSKPKQAKFNSFEQVNYYEVFESLIKLHVHCEREKLRMFKYTLKH